MIWNPKKKNKNFESANLKCMIAQSELDFGSIKKSNQSCKTEASLVCRKLRVIRKTVSIHQQHFMENRTVNEGPLEEALRAGGN